MTIRDFHEAVRTAREQSANTNETRTVHGRKVAIYDLLLDSGAAFSGFGVEPPPTPQPVAKSILGMDVIYDEAMAPNMIDFRDADGATLQRLIQHDGKWYAINVPELLRYGLQP